MTVILKVRHWVSGWVSHSLTEWDWVTLTQWLWVTVTVWVSVPLNDSDCDYSLLIVTVTSWVTRTCTVQYRISDLKSTYYCFVPNSDSFKSSSNLGGFTPRDMPADLTPTSESLKSDTLTTESLILSGSSFETHHGISSCSDYITYTYFS